MTEKKKPVVRFAGFTSDWEQRKVGDYCDMFNGDRSVKYPSAQDMVADGIPFINAGDLEDGRVKLSSANKITREKYDDLGGAKLQLGDIVYCLRGTLGKNAYIDNFDEGTVASSLVAIRPKNIDGRYLFHVFNSDIEYRQRVVHDEGAAQPNLSAKSVSEFLMPVPDIDEQKKLSSFFDHLNHLITLHQRKCDKLKNVKKSMLEKMFPKNGRKVSEIRFAGFTDDWEQRKLGEIATKIGRNDPESTAPIMMITANNGFIEQSERYAFNNAGESLKKYIILKNGELAYNHGASKLRPYGSCFALTDVEIARIPFVYHCFSVGENDSEFISLELNGSNVEKQLRRIVSSGARMDGLLNISFEEYCIVGLNLPTIEEQKQIGTFFRNLDYLITIYQRKLEKLQNIKKSCLEKMFV